MKKSTTTIARNTVMLYTRQIFILIVNLVVVRILLKQLGEEDYGIYNLVAGIATMFSVLSGSMSFASQRFFSVAIGKNDLEELRKTLYTAIVIYILIALIVLILTETIGLWYVIEKLNVPDNRRLDSVFVYECSVIGLMMTILYTPLIALVLSFEDMNLYAIISIIESFGKLFGVLILSLIPFSKLRFYGAYIAVLSALVFGLYFFVYIIKYSKKIKLHRIKDTNLFKQMCSFAGWNLYGSLVSSFKNQLVNIVLNQAFSPIIVTARGIATSINSALISFSTNFGNALRPQIVKRYSVKEENVYPMVYFGSKIVFLLMLLITFPFIYDMHFVLSLWLGDIPQYAEIFSRLALIDALIDCISIPLMPLIDATGNIKKYQIVVGGILLLNLPISYVVIKIIENPITVYYVAIALAVAALVARIFIIEEQTAFSKRFFWDDVLKRILLMVSIVVLSQLIIKWLNFGVLISHIIAYTVFLFEYIVLSWIIAFNKPERLQVKIIIVDFMERRKRK